MSPTLGPDVITPRLLQLVIWSFQDLRLLPLRGQAVRPADSSPTGMCLQSQGYCRLLLSYVSTNAADESIPYLCLHRNLLADETLVCSTATEVADQQDPTKIEEISPPCTTVPLQDATAAESISSMHDPHCGFSATVLRLLVQDHAAARRLHLQDQSTSVCLQTVCAVP